MDSYKRSIILFVISMVIATIAVPAFGLSSTKRRGSTVKTKSFQITNIESKRLDDDASGLIHYSFKARVRNRTKRTLKATFIFHAVDRDGYELEDVYLIDQIIKRNSTRTITDRLVMQRHDYDNIWEWKVVKIRLK